MALVERAERGEAGREADQEGKGFQDREGEE